MRELDITKDAVDQLASKVNEAEKVLSTSQERIQYLVGKLADQSGQGLVRNAEGANEPGPFWKFEGQMKSFLADLQQVQSYNSTIKRIFECINTARALQKTALRQCVSSYVK